MSTDRKKFTLSTDTDLHFDMLADHSKLKILPNLVDQKTNISLSGNVDKSEDSDDEIIDNIDDNSIKFNSSDDEEDVKTKQDFEKKKMLHDYEKKLKEEQRSSSDNHRDDYYDDEDKSETEKKNPYKLNNMSEVPFHMLDEQTRKFKKMEKYAELLAIKNTGIKLTKDYNLNSDYEEMCFEVQYWANYQKKKDAINLGKNFMMNAVTALEFMNERYDPFGFKLKGWSDQMQIGLDGYTPVFGQLYEKWKGSGREMEPEIKLVLMISMSAVSFHASKKMAESLPGLDKVLESNPELLNQLQGMINKNISKEKEVPEKSEDETKMKMYEQMQQLKQQKAKFEQIKKKQNDIQANSERIQQQMNKGKEEKKQQPNIQNVLDRIRAQNSVDNADNVLNGSSDSSESSESERVSVQSTLGKDELDSSNASSKNNEENDLTLTLGSDGKPKRRRRKGKQTITIST